MLHYVFCHGLGYNKLYWQNLLPYFEGKKCSLVNLNYFYEEDIPKIEGEIVGIGHSLGFLKLCKYYKVKYAVAINAFTDFLVSDKKRALELQMLKRSFKKDAKAALERFQERCQVKQEIQDINLKAILDDLDFLAQKHTIDNIPILAIYSEDDTIVPPNITEQNFVKYDVQLEKFCQAGHSLGYNQAEAIYGMIM